MGVAGASPCVPRSWSRVWLDQALPVLLLPQQSTSAWGSRSDLLSILTGPVAPSCGQEWCSPARPAHVQAASVVSAAVAAVPVLYTPGTACKVLKCFLISV